jgi:hypothetical protein
MHCLASVYNKHMTYHARWFLFLEDQSAEYITGP